MNDQELRMAVECQLLLAGNREGLYADALKKFADLIRADERDEILKLADSLGWVDVDNIRARGNT